MDLFLVSLIGFAISLLLWFYFFHKYKTADQVKEESLEEILKVPDIEALINPVPVMPVAAQEEQLKTPKPAPRESAERVVIKPVLSEPQAPLPEVKVKSVSVESPAPQPAPALAAVTPQPQPAAVSNSAPANQKSSQTSPALAISPAVVYLQQVQQQLVGLHKDLEGVKSQVVGINQRNETLFTEILTRLEDIKKVAKESKPIAQAQVTIPTPAQAKAVKAPEPKILEMPKPVVVEPVVPEAIQSPIVIEPLKTKTQEPPTPKKEELPAALEIDFSTANHQPQQAQELAPPPPPEPRKGPVWPE